MCECVNFDLIFLLVWRAEGIFLFYVLFVSRITTKILEFHYKLRNSI